MTTQTLCQIVLATLTHDLLRYVIGAGGVFVLINIALAGALRNRKIRTQRPRAAQALREFTVSLRTVLIFAATGIGIALGAQSGLFDIYDDLSDRGWLWFLASLVLIIVAHDAWFYWTHRAMHHPRLFRRLHRMHHRSHNPTPFAAYSFDIGEAALNAAFLPLFLLLVPMHPAALLIFVTHMMLRNALAHCGYEVFPADTRGRPLFGWLAGVTHHDQHHANARYNMGFYFTWWDRLMGTQHPDYLAKFAQVAPRLPFDRRDLTAALLLALIMLGAATDARAQGRTETISGVYAAPGLWAVVRFAPCAEAPHLTCGAALWGWDMDKWRGLAPGGQIISGLKREGDEWTGGRLTSPYSGHVFRGSIRRAGQGTLILRGCAGPICQRQTWRALPALRSVLARLQ